MIEISLFLSVAIKSCDDLIIVIVYKIQKGKNRTAKDDDDYFACVLVPLVYVSYRWGTEQATIRTRQ